VIVQSPRRKRRRILTSPGSRPKKFEEKEEFTALIFEVFMIQDENSWYINSGATRHIFEDKACCKTYEVIEDGVFLYVGNSSKT